MEKISAGLRRRALCLLFVACAVAAVAQERRRPQTPCPPYPYSTEEVSFLNAADSVLLAGTLTFPEGYTPRRAAATPVVVMVTGSGLQNRDEEVFGHRPFAVIADYLARHGVASLRYDDRGTGASGGNARTVIPASNLRDALAAVEYLRRRGGFGKTGMLGHSEGGLIAVVAAGMSLPAEMGGASRPRRRKHPLSFVVSLSGPGVGGDSIIVCQNRRGLGEAGFSQAAVEGYCAVLKRLFELRRQSPQVKIDAALADSVAAAVAPGLPVLLRANLRYFCDGANPWLEAFVVSDPAEALAAVTCPVMAVGGERDVQVIPDAGVRAIARHLPRSKKHLLKEYAGLNHLLQHCTTGAVTEYGEIEETISEEVLADMAAWILRVAK